MGYCNCRSQNSPKSKKHARSLFQEGMRDRVGRSPTSQKSPSPGQEEVDEEFLEQENIKRTSTHHPSHGTHKPGPSASKDLKKNQKGQAAKKKHNKVMELINGKPALLRLSMNKFEIRYETPYV